MNRTKAPSGRGTSIISLAGFAVAYLWLSLAISILLLVAAFCLDSGIRAVRRSLRQEVNKRRSEAIEAPVQEPTLSDFDARLASLLRSGFDGATLSLQRKRRGSGFRLVFEKYIRAPGDYGLGLVFTLHDWALPFMAQVKAFSENKGLPVRVQDKRTPKGREAVFVDCGKDAALALDLARYLWIEIFGLEETAACSIKQQDISIYGELVDRPDQKPMSMAAGIRYRNPGLMGSKSAGCAADLFWITVLPVVFLGTVVTASNSLGAEPDWVWNLDGHSLAGSTGSLVFFSLFLLGTALGFIRRRRKKVIETLPSGFVTLIWIWGHWLRVTLPLAVLLVWSGA